MNVNPDGTPDPLFHVVTNAVSVVFVPSFVHWVYLTAESTTPSAEVNSECWYAPRVGTHRERVGDQV
jgi:hypothetical protein